LSKSESKAYQLGADAAKGVVGKIVDEILEKKKQVEAIEAKEEPPAYGNVSTPLANDDPLRLAESCIAFFASCIRCGEKFDETCETSQQKAMFAIGVARERFRGEVDAHEKTKAALKAEREKNLLDRKQILFLNAVQTWLCVAGAQGQITPCGAAKVQMQAALVGPSLLGPLVTLHDQACEFCKSVVVDGTLPLWCNPS
jgi:hypothetical protein